MSFFKTGICMFFIGGLLVVANMLLWLFAEDITSDESCASVITAIVNIFVELFLLLMIGIERGWFA